MNYKKTTSRVSEILSLSKKIGPLTIFVFCFVFVVSSFGHVGKHVYKMGTGQIPFETMLADLSLSEVIFVGERHSDVNHHKTQLAIIKGLHQKGEQLSIGLEMFMARDQQKLDDWVAGTIPEKDFISIFNKNWGIGWQYYRDIFIYARDNKIPLLGLNVPREITRKVARSGFQSLTDKELKQLPPGISCDLDERYKSYIKRLFSFKGNTEKAFVYFCEAQVVWDQSMAWYLARDMQKNPKRKAVVLAGAIHAWRFGIARQLKKYAERIEYRVVLPGLPADYQDISTQDADYLVLHL